MEIARRITGMEREGAWLRVFTDGPELRAVFVTDEILRLRVSFDRAFREESYVLMTTAWPDRLDPLFTGERQRVEPVEPAYAETARGCTFRSAALLLELEREPFCLRLFDASGALLYATLPGLSFTRDGNGRVTAYSLMREDDCFYGFGEKGGALNKSMTFLRERATDCMGYDAETSDTLYKHIPFYLQLDRGSRKAVGVFCHNFHECVFNLGREKSNYRPRYSYWQADGGDIDLFLLGGGAIPRILDNYTRLTGRPVLLPKRALGYQGSGMRYAEGEKDCDRAVLDFVDTARAEGFPVDGFHLSSGYTNTDGRRCVFTWNRERFPDPGAFLRAMAERGAPCAANVKPGLLMCHPRYEEFAAAGVFVRDGASPDSPAVGAWWGGEGSLWDFTNPKAREIWKTCLRQALLEQGPVDIWNDNCEYDSLPDTDAHCDYDGAGGTLAALRPLMATLMSKLAAEAAAERDADARPYVICRAGSAGIQRYAQTWAGDNTTCWKSLRFGIPMLLGMGLSGQPNEGADIGGFAGPAPEEELFVRWVQNGIFQPRFSIHSANCDNTVTEPWMYSGTRDLIREALQLRCRLLPYLYSAEYEAHCTGAPIMRPLVYAFQEDPRACDESFSFLFGHGLLVANVLEPGAKTRRLYLPAACRWYDGNDGFRPYAGGQEIEVPVTLSTIPMFVREGAVIPMAEEAPERMAGSRIRALRLLLVPGREESCYTLYDDDGETMAYTRGVFRKTFIRMRGEDTVTVDFCAEGTYPDTVERVTVEMIHRAGAPLTVTLDGEELPQMLTRRAFETAKRGWYYSMSTRTVLIRYPNPRRDVTLTVSFVPTDVIGM